MIAIFLATIIILPFIIGWILPKEKEEELSLEEILIRDGVLPENTVEDNKDVRIELAEKFKGKSIEEICLYNKEVECCKGKLTDEFKSILLQDLYNYTEEEAMELLNTVKQEKKKLKLRKAKRNLKQKIKEKYGDIPIDSRELIPEDIQNKVWNRDGGKCVKCGSNEKLEFDHIIPVSKGGANTVRNIQLLCEKCNREKSNNIG